MSIRQQLADFLREIPNFGATSIEKNFDPKLATSWAAENYWIPITLVILYMSFCYFGTILMRKYEKGYDLRYLLAGWNAALSLFSFIGMVRTVPHLLASLLTQEYQATICTRPHDEGSWGGGVVGFWVMCFIFSKIPELIDTVFIVLRKKPLIFLHWYHHVTVLLYCWDAYATLAGSGLYFVAMNYSVHALMYGYYCLQALNMCPKNFPTYLITMSQIAQMFVGTGVCISSWYFVYKTDSCHNTKNNLIAGAIMYGSYLYLFCAFAVDRFIRKKPTKGKVEGGSKDNSESKKVI